MRKFLLVSISICWLVSLGGCASIQRPRFHKSMGGEVGYRLENEKTATFKVFTNLPDKTDLKYSIIYATRAVAEECLARGFRFYEVGVVHPNELDGYCYPSADHKGLGLEFTDLGLGLRPQRFFVASLNGKTKTELKLKDELQEIDGAPVTSLAQLKSEIAKAVEVGHTSVELKIWREGTALKIKEPIALFKNSAMGSDQLDLLRSRIR